jgi:hypothetical protein
MVDIGGRLCDIAATAVGGGAAIGSVGTELFPTHLRN